MENGELTMRDMDHPESIHDSWTRIAIYFILCLILLSIPFVIFVPEARLSSTMALLLLMMTGSLVILIRGHAARTVYRCSACGHEFKITPLTDFLSPHTLATKYLRCPACKKRGWMPVRTSG
jgi:DNA-directed RNA polymerase subunit RPC12/RpoP